VTRWSLLACGLLFSCKSDPPPPSTTPPLITPRPALPPSASAADTAVIPGASASVAAPPRPRVIPTEQVISFAGQGGVSLSASWYKASPEAPVGVLLHRLGGQRAEWQPLVQRLLKDGPELSLLVLDQRGHGQSGASEGRVGGGLQGKDIERMAEDLGAALAEVDRRLERKAGPLIGVGADLGATVLALAASQEPRWSGLVLMAPVAGLRGVDIYRPFAAVRRRPTLLIAAREDPVSLEPFKAMSSMVGGALTSKQYEGQEHNIVRLASATPALWPDVVGWVTAAVASAPSPSSSSSAAPSLSASASAPSASGAVSAGPGASAPGASAPPSPGAPGPGKPKGKGR
jgi:pimeloyl-ACP methyl ester carboxylesterase